MNKAVDAIGLATVADSLAAIEQRVEQEGRLTWAELMRWLDSDWAGAEGEQARLMMHSIPRYGSGGSRGGRLGAARGTGLCRDRQGHQDRPGPQHDPRAV